MRLERSTALVLVVSAALMVWYMHFREIDVPKKVPRTALHEQIVGKSAPAPYRYRILMPWLAEGISRILEPVSGEDRALLLAYGSLEALALAALATVLFLYLASFFAPETALVGTLFAELSLVVALRDHYFQPWSILDALAFVLAAHLVWKRGFGRLLVLMVPAALNRETSAFIPLLYLLAARDADSAKARVGRSVLLFGVWLATYLAVRFFQGSAPHIYDAGEILAKNLSGRYLLLTSVNLVLLMGGFWVFAARGLKRASPFVRRMALFVPFYLAAVIVFGVWKEVRLLLPLYPVIIPAGLYYLFGGDAADGQAG